MSLRFSGYEPPKAPPVRTAPRSEFSALLRDASAPSTADRDRIIRLPARAANEVDVAGPFSFGKLAELPALNSSYVERVPQDPFLLRKQLQELFNGDLFDALQKGKHWKKEIAINIDGLSANISVSSGNGRVFIAAPEDPLRVLRIDLDANGAPTKIASIYDREQYLPRMATRLGLDMGKQGFNENPSGLKAWADDLAAVRVHDERVASLSNDFQNHSRPFTKYFGKPGMLVNQDTFQASGLRNPLATVGLDTCSALIVIDPESGKHYLAHIDANSKPESIAASLSQLNLGSADIYLAPGSGDIKLSMRNAVSAIDSLGMAEKIKLMKLEGPFPGVAVHQGRVFSFPSGTNLEGWNDDKNTRF